MPASFDQGTAAEHAASITPNNDTDLSNIPRGIYVGGGGNVRLTTTHGETVTFTSIQAGTILPVRAKRVLSTSTTATNLIALW